MNRTIRVKSNFAADNAAFSSPQEAIEHSRSYQAGRILIPDEESLIIKSTHFDDEFSTLRIQFANGHEIAINAIPGHLAAESGHLAAKYGESPGDRTSQGLHTEEAAPLEINLHFVDHANSYKWHPEEVLGKIKGARLSKTHQLKGSIFLYTEDDCIYVSTLKNSETGETLLFWTEST